jgi:hypothetical protein
MRRSTATYGVVQSEWPPVTASNGCESAAL